MKYVIVNSEYIIVNNEYVIMNSEYVNNIINYNTCTMSGQILLCSSVPHACTWKIVFNIQNNELNELSECMLYKIFFFFLKTSQNCKILFYKIFSRSLALLCLL